MRDNDRPSNYIRHSTPEALNSDTSIIWYFILQCANERKGKIVVEQLWRDAGTLKQFAKVNICMTENPSRGAIGPVGK